MINKDNAIKVLKEYKDLILNNEFNELYVSLDTITSYYSDVSSITQLFIDAGVIDEVLSHLTTIPAGMFYGLPITNITIPGNITNMGWRAFAYCTELTRVILDDGITDITTAAFSDCTSLTSITIPDSVRKIGSYAFFGCTSLTDVVIPDSVTYIGEEAFTGCGSLTNITIPSKFESNLEKIFGENHSRINFTFI